MLKPIVRTVTVVLGCAAASVAIAQAPPPGPGPGAGHAQGQIQGPAHPDSAPHAAPPASPAETHKALHALGFLLARNLEPFALTPAEFDAVRQGFAEGYRQPTDSKDSEALVPQIQALERERTLRSGAAYAARAAAQRGAVKTASGLVYIPVKEGTGATPTPRDRVKVMYEGRLTNGVVFDSTQLHGGNPAVFPVSGVLACWTEALQRMKVGGKARIVCPASIAYGQRAQPPKIRPNSTLDFNIELLDVIPPPAAAAPRAPAIPGVPAVPAAPGAPARPGAPNPASPH